jgi:hypothetical protein
MYCYIFAFPHVQAIHNFRLIKLQMPFLKRDCIMAVHLTSILYLPGHPALSHCELQHCCPKLNILIVSCCVLLCSTIIQPSTQQIHNKQINITVLIFVYYVYLLHVSI